jgi:cytochrome c oxidase subunit 2
VTAKRVPIRTAATLPILLLLAAACGGGPDSAPSALRPKGSEAESLADLWWVMFGMAAFVYLIVGGLIILAALRNRSRSEARPSRMDDTKFIVFGGVAIPLVFLMTLAGLVVGTTGDLRRPDKDALRIDVEGADWFWKVRYPEHDIETANEMHVPVGRPLSIRLTSRDVVHSFWVPQLTGKQDLVPGQVNTLTFTVNEPGRYLGECAEYCGLQHARMQFWVVGETPVDFERWVARRTAPPPEPPDELAARGRLVFMREACAGCHRIRGTQAQGELGPDLSDFGSRLTIGAGTVENVRGHLAGWVSNSQSIKPGNLMPPVNLSPEDLHALVAYLESLKG